MDSRYKAQEHTPSLEKQNGQVRLAIRARAENVDVGRALSACRGTRKPETCFAQFGQRQIAREVESWVCILTVT